MTWGAWWAYSPTGWQICFSAWPVAMAFYAQLADPEPVSELSDERLAEFISPMWDDVELPQERP